MLASRLRSAFKITALAAAVALVAAGCGTPYAGGGGDAEGVPTLTIWTGDAQARGLTEPAAAWGQERGVTVNVQVVPGDQLQTQFVTAAQAGQGPDIVMGAHDWIGNLVQNGTIDPIPMTEDTKALFNPQAIQAVTFNGQVYGVPIAVENVVLFRNTSLVPNAPQTFDELVAIGQQLQASGQVSEILALPVGDVGDAYHAYPIYTSAGGYMFGTEADGDYNPADLGVAQPSAVAAFEKFRQLGETGVGALKRSITSENVNSLFTGQQTAFMISGPWQIAQIETAGTPYDITPVPGFADGQPARPFVGVQAMYVASGSPFKSLAQEFAQTFFTEPENVVALYAADPRPPALTAALEQIQQEQPNVLKVVEAAEGGDPMPAIPEMATVWDPFGKAEAAVIGGADPATTVEAAADVIAQQIS